MATFTALTDPLIRKAVLHVYNKHRLQQKGGTGESRLKYVATSADLAHGYGCIIASSLLKNKRVSTLDT